jgi:hypothetical protein
MRRVLPIVWIPFLFASCSKFQYYSVASDNTSKDQEQKFIDQNDICDIIYDFSGEKGPMRITVYNKSNRPLNIDWKRSAIIEKETSTSFFDPNVKFAGEIQQNNTIAQNIIATILPPEPVQFIPPQSTIIRQTFFINNKFLNLNKYRNTKETLKTGYGKKKMKRYKFSHGYPPIFFRIYLTFIKDDNSSFAIEHSFYVTDIVETRATPDNFGTDEGDRFYIRGHTHFGNVSTAIAAICITAFLIAAL